MIHEIFIAIIAMLIGFIIGTVLCLMATESEKDQDDETI